MYFKDLSKEDQNKFNNLLKQVMTSVQVFEKTGKRSSFLALQDQITSFRNEIVLERKRTNNE